VVLMSPGAPVIPFLFVRTPDRSTSRSSPPPPFGPFLLSSYPLSRFSWFFFSPRYPPVRGFFHFPLATFCFVDFYVFLQSFRLYPCLAHPPTSGTIFSPSLIFFGFGFVVLPLFRRRSANPCHPYSPFSIHPPPTGHCLL